jgi:lipopolysaccharide export LptBFGC system permease protein LptF
MKKLYLYIIKEFIPNYLLGFTFFSIFLLIQLLFQIVSLYVEDNVPLVDVLELLIYGIAWVVSFSIPIAVLLGTVLTLGRISGDSEIVAMRANGIGLLKVFTPVIFLGVAIMMFNLYYYEVIYPWGMFKYYDKYLSRGVKDPTTQLSENFIYEDRQSPYVIKVGMVERQSRDLINVEITSLSDNKLILAEKGRFLDYNADKEVFPLELINTITQPFMPDKEEDMGDARFYEMRSPRMVLYIPFRIKESAFQGNFSSSWSTSKLATQMQQKEVQYSAKKLNNANEQADLIAEIARNGGIATIVRREGKYHFMLDFGEESVEQQVKDKIEDLFKKLKERAKDMDKSYQHSSENIPDKYHLEYHKKLSYSFSCLMFALLGAPLAVFSSRSGKSYGLGLSLLFIAVWYVAHFVSERLLNDFEPINIIGLFTIDVGDPILRAWLPPLILLPVAAFLWYNKLKT